MLGSADRKIVTGSFSVHHRSSLDKDYGGLQLHGESAESSSRTEIPNGPGFHLLNVFIFVFAFVF